MSKFAPKVFISYSHDSPEHRDRVLELCDRLRSHGIQAKIDQYEISPPEGWPRWCAARVREADFVLVVCSEIYERRFRGSEEPGRGQGASWEGYIVTQELYEAGARNTKFIPVILPGGKIEHIPDVLRGATRYKLEEEYLSLYRHLTHQPSTTAPPIGALMPLARQVRRTSHFSATPAREEDWRKAISEELEKAYLVLEALIVCGSDTRAIRNEILELRRKLRDGDRLQAGDFLSEGRFKLIDVVGRGGFSTVWKALDRTRRELVAVKILHGQYSEDRSRRERFFRGAHKMAELHHPGIVRVIEQHLEEDQFHYFVMEYVGGGDLRQAVLSGRLSQEKIIPLILSIGEALDFAHSKRIIHRDVKPGNVLLDGDHPKLTDFDLVRDFDSTGGTRTQDHLGSLIYTAPEILDNAKDAGVGADVYSLAMTAVFAYHGRDLALEAWRRPEAFVDNLPCSAAIREALRQGITERADERLGSVRTLCQALLRGIGEDDSLSAWDSLQLDSAADQATGMTIFEAHPELLRPDASSYEPTTVSSDVGNDELVVFARDSKTPTRVLVVDDVDHGREIFREFLEFRGFQVETAADGLGALEKAFAYVPDVILMDLSLPGLDGWEATRRLKLDERTKHIPVIAVTAHHLAAAHDKAREVGCAEIVTKPCLPKDLESAIRKLVGIAPIRQP